MYDAGHSTALPRSEWESHPIPEEPEVRFYFNHLHRHWFYPGQTEHTADRAHPTQVLEPSTYWSLHCIPKKKKKRCGDRDETEALEWRYRDVSDTSPR